MLFLSSSSSSWILCCFQPPCFGCFDGSLHFFFTNLPCVFLLEFHICHGLNVANTTGFLREKDGLCSLVSLLGLRHRLQGLRLLFGQLLAILLRPMGWWKEAKKDGGKQKCPKSSSNFQERWVSPCDVACFLAVKMQIFRKMSVKRCYEHWTHHWRPHWNSLIWKPPTESLVMSLTASLKRSSSSCSVEKLEGPATPRLTAFVALPKWSIEKTLKKKTFKEKPA